MPPLAAPRRVLESLNYAPSLRIYPLQFYRATGSNTRTEYVQRRMTGEMLIFGKDCNTCGSSDFVEKINKCHTE